MTQIATDNDNDGAGCFAVLWFDSVLLIGAVGLMWPVVSLSAFGCPSGGPDCGPGRALLLLFGSTGAVAAAFTVIVLGLVRLSRRWHAAALALALVGLALLAIPMLSLASAIFFGDGGLVLVFTIVWLAVPALAILADARALLRGPRRSVRPVGEVLPPE